jgi:hypothetical protein
VHTNGSVPSAEENTKDAWAKPTGMTTDTVHRPLT